jgi:hypothetical protein
MLRLVARVFTAQERIPDQARGKQCKSNADQKSNERSILEMGLKNKGSDTDNQQQKDARRQDQTNPLNRHCLWITLPKERVITPAIKARVCQEKRFLPRFNIFPELLEVARLRHKPSERRGVST